MSFITTIKSTRVAPQSGKARHAVYSHTFTPLYIHTVIFKQSIVYTCCKQTERERESEREKEREKDISELLITCHYVINSILCQDPVDPFDYRIAGFFWRDTNLAIWDCQGMPLILAYIILANLDSIIKKNLITVFTFDL
jgi:hypothetical protein